MSIDDGFHFLRVDVLSICRKDHILAAAADGDIAFLVHNTEVSGMEETVIGKGIGRSLRIVEITAADIETLSLDLTNDVLWIIRIDAHFAGINLLSAGTLDELGWMGICKKRCSLRHTVADGIWKTHLAEGLLNIRIESCATHNELFHIAAESLYQLVGHELVYGLVDDRNGCENLHYRF